jgi:hypothetical protein
MAKVRQDVLPPAEPEATKAYVCTCGYKEADWKKFSGHLLAVSRKEPGSHHSKGFIDLISGEVIRPPAAQRTLQQKTAVEKESREKRRAAQGREPSRPSVTQYTSNLNAAQQIQFIPRVITMDFSPVLRAAYDCARREWGWDMEFPDWLDTWVYKSYKMVGVTLNDYSIEETPEEREERLAVIQSKRHNGELEEETEEGNNDSEK